MSAGLRVVVAEDLALLRDGLVRLLTASGIEVVAAVEDGETLLDKLLEQRPDVAVVDVRLPPTFTDEGLRAAIAARQKVPGLPVLVLSQYVEQVYARELLSDGTGSVGYLLKDRVFDVDDFVAAVRQVAGGGTVMDPDVVTHLLTQPANRNPIDRLTARERDVLQLIAQGRSNSAIASTLGVTDNAITFHTANIFAKLDLPPSASDNRRVLAMLTYLNGRASA
ncbi:MAG TPA: response regulator transcription factor [Pseudonocardiaceae bacterium]|nr:response regulator transcription factor [Pseudonocardiaceae bacterium]